MEVGNLRKSESELKQQLATTVTELQKNTDAWTTLKLKQDGKMSCVQIITFCSYVCFLLY